MRVISWNVIIESAHGGGFNYGSSSGGGKWLDSGFMFKIEPNNSTEGPGHHHCSSPRLSISSTQQMEFPLEQRDRKRDCI